MSASSRNGGGNNCLRDSIIQIEPLRRDDCGGYITVCCIDNNLGSFNSQYGRLDNDNIRNIRKALKENGYRPKQITKIVGFMVIAFQKILERQEKQRALENGATNSFGQPGNCGSGGGGSFQAVSYQMPEDLFSSFSLGINLEVRRGQEFYTISINGTELVAPRINNNGNYTIINGRPIHAINLDGFSLLPVPIQNVPTYNTRRPNTLSENRDAGGNNEEGDCNDCDCCNPCPCPCPEGQSFMDCCIGPWKDLPSHPGALSAQFICNSLSTPFDL